MTHAALVDQYGAPLPKATADPGLRGGWVRTGGGIERPTTVSDLVGQPLSRHVERTAARLAYLTNPLVYGAVEIIHSLTIGDETTYGRLADDRANTAWAEFWEINELHEMLDRVFREHMVDGETLTLWPVGSETLRRHRDQPARIGLYDVAMGWTLESEPGLPGVIAEVLTDANVHYRRGEFTYQGHLAGMWNDPRGWPAVMQAVPAALAYVAFVNSRIRLHRIQSRINGIYKAFIDPHLTPEDQMKALEIRSAGFERIPDDGAVITIGMDPASGQAEDFSFPNTDKRSVDASEDGRLIRMLFATALNLPLLLLSDGEDANRASGTAQVKATTVALRKRQRIAWRWLQQIGRTELKRRYGPAQTYKVETLERKGGRVITVTSRVTANMLQLPVNLPDVTEEDAVALIEKVRFSRDQGWLSSQTGAGMLGIDLLQELEQMAAEGEEGNERAGEEGGPSGGEGFSEDDRNQARILHANTLAKQANEQDPNIGLHWAHIITAPGAGTAPGAYLQGALPKDANGEPVPINLDNASAGGEM